MPLLAVNGVRGSPAGDRVVARAREDDIALGRADQDVRAPVADDPLRPRRRGEGEQEREAECYEQWPQVNPLPLGR
jgi:hypothetical protein